MQRLLALLAVALAALPAAAARPGHEREDASRLVPALRTLRPAGPRPLVVAPGGGAPRVYVVVGHLTPARRAALEAAGLGIEVPAPRAPAPAWPGGEVVQGTATAAAQAAIAALPFVRRLARPGRAWTSVGAVTTAGDALLHVDQARAILGTDGTGATVGVISDGADHRAASIASGDLPADVTLPPIAGLGAGQGDEGTALMEIVHDLAPGARLLFAAPQTSVEMLAAIDGLAAAGAQVIVDDLVFTDEPKFEDGPVAASARAFVAGGGVYVTAAGNFARVHYYATYRPTASAALQGASYAAMHDFGGGDVGDTLSLPPGADLLAILQWNDPFGAAADDFDLVLAAPGPGADVVLAASTDVQDGHGDPIEAVEYVNRTGAVQPAYLAIAEFHRVTPAADLRLNLLLLSHSQIVQQYVVPRESIFGHAAAAPAVLSVTAAPAARPRVIEPFASRGPASIFFPVRATRAVPTLTAVDGVETAVGLRGEFVNPFFGTSAAAPHVAGCAALLRAAGIAPARIAPALTSTALPLARTAPAASGAGLLDCANAALAATGAGGPPAVAAVTAGFDPTAALVVTARGADPDGDLRRASVTVEDDAGAILARRAPSLAGSGGAFSIAFAARAPRLARARRAIVTVSDAAGLRASATAAIVCPGDASLGDALCGVGDLLAAAATVRGGSGRRLRQGARQAAAALVRAGRATASGRVAAARAAVRAATALLGRVARLAGRAAQDGIGAAAAALAGRLAALAA